MRWITFESQEVKIKVKAMLTGPTKMVQHHPEGWQAVQRLSRPSFTEWQGSAGWELQVPIIFDGLRVNKSQEGDIRLLEQLAKPWSKFEPQRPPICTIDSQGDIAHDVIGSPPLRWVIGAIEWDDYTSNKQFKRVRQPATVTLLEYNPELVMKIKPVTKTKPGIRKPPVTLATGFLHRWKPPKTYKVRAGDTLQKLCAWFYGDQGRWRELAQKNNITDPNHLKVGSTLQML